MADKEEKIAIANELVTLIDSRGILIKDTPGVLRLALVTAKQRKKEEKRK